MLDEFTRGLWRLTPQDPESELLYITLCRSENISNDICSMEGSRNKQQQGLNEK